MSIENKYVKLTEIEHVLKRPGRYVGSITNHTALAWVVGDDLKMVKREVTWNPALIKLFDEVISNSVDESKRSGSKLDTIKITIDEKSGKLTIEDNGGIPVVIHKEHNQYVPELIFSELRAGSNFDDDSEDMVTGQNGEGSSLVNILSKTFEVRTADGKREFSQTFKENMHKRTKPRISDSTKKFTRISFVPDYELFGTQLDEDNISKITKRVYDVAGCNPHLKVSINGKRIKINSFKDYVKLYTDDFIYDDNANWRIAFASSSDGFQHVSFVNGTESSSGGSHIDYVMNQIVSEIQAYIKKKHKLTVRAPDIKNHMTLFVDCNVVNPRYSSQTKEELITEVRDFKTTYELPNSVVTKILKSDVIQEVLDWVEMKLAANEKAALRKNQKDLNKKKVSAHIPANSKNREECTLFITEGLSAISNLVNVRDPEIHGGYPLRGKPLNVYGKKSIDILANNELSDIMSIIGLSLGEKAVDLNYGIIGIMADADYDGLNIVTLLINFFANWPELFEEGRIKILLTPIVIARKKRTIKRFYMLDDFTKVQDKLIGYTIEYNKGLGSLDVDEYELAINSPKYNTVILGDDYKESLSLAFNKKSQDARKKWLLTVE